MSILVPLALIAAFAQAPPAPIPVMHVDTTAKAVQAPCLDATFHVTDIGDGSARVDAIASWPCRNPPKGHVALDVGGELRDVQPFAGRPIDLQAKVPIGSLPLDACVVLKTDRGQIVKVCGTLQKP